jgi:hypothetical protein
MNTYTPEQIEEMVDRPQSFRIIQAWFNRGDGCAVYENHDMGHPGMGDKKFVSYGSPTAQLEVNEPPQRLPDIGGDINWRYWLIGTCRP